MRLTRTCADSLTNLGYRVAGVIDPGREAIQVAEQVRPDLVLMEISFEGCLSGLATAGEIRNRLNIPIIFLAEEADRDTIAKANAIAPYGYLLRPFSSTELDTAISIAINQHRLVQATFAEQAWLTTMLRSLSDAVIATDDHGCVRFLNPPAEALTGWTLKEAFGLPIEDIYDLATLRWAETRAV